MHVFDDNFSFSASHLSEAPFGQVVYKTGPFADTNPWQFSTKYCDTETRPSPSGTGLLYFGHRYYSPELGRWLSRDPIGEDGGLLLRSGIGGHQEDWSAYFHLFELYKTLLASEGGEWALARLEEWYDMLGARFPSVARYMARSIGRENAVAFPSLDIVLQSQIVKQTPDRSSDLALYNACANSCVMNFDYLGLLVTHCDWEDCNKGEACDRLAGTHSCGTDEGVCGWTRTRRGLMLCKCLEL
jgi:RHS repeat-associated protein